MKIIFNILPILFLIPVTSFSENCFTNEKALQTIDRVYDNKIKSVLLYPTTGALTDVLAPPVISINETRNLLLSFDELGDNNENYYVKILNCNSDWSLSNLNSIMFMVEYNEYQITDRNLSFNTRVPYTHYKFNVPKTKISGNFLIIVYRDSNEDDLMLSKRFMVYENEVTINPFIKFPFNGNERNTSQRVDFTINYEPSIQNPMERMSVVLRQNYNWSNAIYDLKPVFMRDEIRTYEYTFFNNENVFKGGNEFRFFDLRSLRSNGMNVSKIVPSENKTEVLLGYDQTRAGTSYGTSFDLNGFYVPEHYETKGFETDPDYAEVIFTLNYRKIDLPPGRIFIMGALSDWSLQSNLELKWDADYNVFTCTALLKQGYYNYSYAFLPNETSTIDFTFFEGSFSQTQNVYDLIAYYRGPGGMFDRIVGYKSANYLDR